MSLFPRFLNLLDNHKLMFSRITNNNSNSDIALQLFPLTLKRLRWDLSQRLRRPPPTWATKLRHLGILQFLAMLAMLLHLRQLNNSS